MLYNSAKYSVKSPRYTAYLIELLFGTQITLGEILLANLIYQDF